MKHQIRCRDPDKTEVLAQVDLMIDHIDRALQRSEANGSGLVELTLALKHARRLREMVSHERSNTISWQVIAEQVLAVLDLVTKLYSLFFCAFIVERRIYVITRCLHC